MSKINNHWLRWFVFCFGVIILDQVSKGIVLARLHPYEPVHVLPFFNLTLAFNTGAAFSFLSSSGKWHQWFFTAFAIVMSVILVIWLLRTKAEQRLQSAGISLILAGAVGNLIDRFSYGHVIDFLNFHIQHHHWPIFNIADSAICIGAALLIIDMLKNNKTE